MTPEEDEAFPGEATRPGWTAEEVRRDLALQVMDDHNVQTFAEALEIVDLALTNNNP